MKITGTRSDFDVIQRFFSDFFKQVIAPCNPYTCPGQTVGEQPDLKHTVPSLAMFKTNTNTNNQDYKEKEGNPRAVFQKLLPRKAARNFFTPRKRI